jgi:hypothetical protein
VPVTTACAVTSVPSTVSTTDDVLMPSVESEYSALMVGIPSPETVDPSDGSTLVMLGALAYATGGAGTHADVASARASDSSVRDTSVIPAHTRGAAASRPTGPLVVAPLPGTVPPVPGAVGGVQHPQTGNTSAPDARDSGPKTPGPRLRAALIPPRDLPPRYVRCAALAVPSVARPPAQTGILHIPSRRRRPLVRMADGSRGRASGRRGN